MNQRRLIPSFFSYTREYVAFGDPTGIAFFNCFTEDGYLCLIALLFAFQASQCSRYNLAGILIAPAFDVFDSQSGQMREYLHRYGG